MNDMVISDANSVDQVIQITCDEEWIIDQEDFHAADLIHLAALSKPSKKEEGRLTTGRYHVQVLAVVTKLKEE